MSFQRLKSVIGLLQKLPQKFFGHFFFQELIKVRSFSELKSWAAKYRKPLIWIGLPIVWFGSGYIRLPSTKTMETPLLQVRVIHSQAQSFHPKLRLQGVTAENRKIQLKSEIDGKVIEIKAPKGTYLKKEDPILRISMESKATELAEAEAALKQKEIEYQATVKLAEKKLRSKADVARAQAALRSAKVKWEQATDRIKDTQITAPFDGVVEDCLVQEGSSIRPGESVATFLETATLKAVLNPTDKDLQGIQKDATVLVRNLEGQTFKGKVSFIAAAADIHTRTFKMEVDVENKSQELRVGIPVEADVITTPVLAHKISPAYLSYSDEGDLGIKSVDKNNIVHFHKAHIVSHNESDIWLTGIPHDLMIITEGHEYAQIGLPVRAAQTP